MVSAGKDNEPLDVVLEPSMTWGMSRTNSPLMGHRPPGQAVMEVELELDRVLPTSAERKVVFTVDNLGKPTKERDSSSKRGSSRHSSVPGFRGITLPTPPLTSRTQRPSPKIALNERPATHRGRLHKASPFEKKEPFVPALPTDVKFPRSQGVVTYDMDDFKRFKSEAKATAAPCKLVAPPVGGHHVLVSGAEGGSDREEDPACDDESDSDRTYLHVFVNTAPEQTRPGGPTDKKRSRGRAKVPPPSHAVQHAPRSAVGGFHGARPGGERAALRLGAAARRDDDNADAIQPGIKMGDRDKPDEITVLAAPGSEVPQPKSAASGDVVGVVKSILPPRLDHESLNGVTGVRAYIEGEMADSRRMAQMPHGFQADAYAVSYWEAQGYDTELGPLTTAGGREEVMRRREEAGAPVDERIVVASPTPRTPPEDSRPETSDQEVEAHQSSGPLDALDEYQKKRLMQRAGGHKGGRLRRADGQARMLPLSGSQLALGEEDGMGVYAHRMNIEGSPHRGIFENLHSEDEPARLSFEEKLEALLAMEDDTPWHEEGLDPIDEVNELLQVSGISGPWGDESRASVGPDRGTTPADRVKNHHIGHFFVVPRRPSPQPPVDRAYGYPKPLRPREEMFQHLKLKSYLARKEKMKLERSLRENEKGYLLAASTRWKNAKRRMDNLALATARAKRFAYGYGTGDFYEMEMRRREDVRRRKEIMEEWLLYGKSPKSMRYNMLSLDVATLMAMGLSPDQIRDPSRKQKNEILLQSATSRQRRMSVLKIQEGMPEENSVGSIVMEINPGDVVEFYKQGNPLMYTPENLERRAKLKTNRMIQERIARMFRIFVGNDVALDDPKAILRKEEYMELNARVFLTLSENYDVDNAWESAEFDWYIDMGEAQNDGGAGDLMRWPQFLNSVFTLVDLWTHGVDPMEYVAFLDILRMNITYKEKKTEILRFKDIAEIHCIDTFQQAGLIREEQRKVDHKKFSAAEWRERMLRSDSEGTLSEDSSDESEEEASPGATALTSQPSTATQRTPALGSGLGSAGGHSPRPSASETIGEPESPAGPGQGLGVEVPGSPRAMFLEGAEKVVQMSRRRSLGSALQMHIQYQIQSLFSSRQELPKSREQPRKKSRRRVGSDGSTGWTATAFDQTKEVAVAPTPPTLTPNASDPSNDKAVHVG